MRLVIAPGTFFLKTCVTKINNISYNIGIIVDVWCYDSV